MSDSSPLPPFEAPYAPDDGVVAARLLAAAGLGTEQEQRIDRTATRLIKAIRANDDPLGGVEDMLREFALSTKEGLALMVLAEALLRVPDAHTADRFIEDKLGHGDFVHHETRSSAFLVNASAWALGMSARVIQPGETPQGTIGRLAKRLGAAGGARRHAAGDAADGQSFRARRDHRGGARTGAGRTRAPAPRYSFDMLGEGARTAADATRYFNAYASAIEAIGRDAGHRPLPDRPGISVKLSALHPRYEAVSQARVMSELVPRLIDLARRAKAHDLNFTVDAEEADRLELSLDVVAAALADRSLSGWDGFGLAIQAYQKRASAVIDYADGLARSLNRRLMVRLVKGAYWDTEIKRAQERGLDDYPVFTRKAMTDLNYVACARQMLALRPRIFPQFATHNALTVATILELTGKQRRFRIPAPAWHGRSALRATGPMTIPSLPAAPMRRSAAIAICWPIWCGDCWRTAPIPPSWRSPPTRIFRSRACCAVRPTSSAHADQARHPNIPLPHDLYRPQRINSRGIEFGERAALGQLLSAVARDPPNGQSRRRTRSASRRPPRHRGAGWI